jgi:hypothetical protein
MSAAPKAVAQEATIMDIDAQGHMKVREGRGSFTCMPDNPATPGNDPMCLDKADMEWGEGLDEQDPAAGGGQVRVHAGRWLGREQ